MKRQQAFINKDNKFLKGGLHCHTTISDGDGDPAEVIRLHKSEGYDFLALTDHRKYNCKNYAEDVDITIIPGMEIDNTFERGKGFRCFHEVVIGPDDETNGYKHGETFPRGNADNQEEFQAYLDDAHAKNNLTIYCHPQWSSTPTRYFKKLKGNFAMEIWNTGCAIECNMDTDNGMIWDELLGQGQKIYAVATDDGHPVYQHCKGWVMVNAENNVKSILKALENGEFYSSCGPVIRDFYVDDEGKAHVECSECKEVVFCCDMQPSRKVVAGEEPVTDAVYDRRDDYRYIRAYVEDFEGKRAWTNPIFLED